MSQELYNGENQAAKADGTEAGSQGSLAGAASGTSGQTVWEEVPGAVDACDGGVDRVFEPLGDPVHCKGNKGDEPDDFGMAAAATVTGTVIAGRLEPVVDSDQGNRIIGTQGGGYQPSHQTDEVDMAILLADIDGGPEHEGGEGDAADPGPEAESEKDAEDQEDNTGSPVAAIQVEDSGADSPADVKDACHPDELLGEEAREPDIAVSEHDGDDQNEEEEDERSSIEGEVICPAIDASALDISRCCISTKRDGRHSDEATAEEEELGRASWLADCK